jgi:hypothetical protein
VQALAASRQFAQELRPNPSLERTSTGMALGPRSARCHHPLRGPSTIPVPARSAQTLGLGIKSTAMPAVWLCGFVTVVLFVGLAWYLAPLNPSILALQFAFTPQAFGTIIHTWPAEHLARYRGHLPFDCLLLLVYGSFGYLLATRSKVFASVSPAIRQFASWALPVAAIGDATENALHWWLTEVPRFGVPVPYAAAAVAATLKWAFVCSFGALTAYALLREREA